MIKILKTLCFIFILAFSNAHFTDIAIKINLEAQNTYLISKNIIALPIAYYLSSLFLGLYLGTIKSPSNNKLIFSNDLKSLFKTIILSIFLLASIIIFTYLLMLILSPFYYSNDYDFSKVSPRLFIIIGLSQGFLATHILANKFIYINDYTFNEKGLIFLTYVVLWGMILLDFSNFKWSKFISGS